jgi:co-chaperonin GroES (HSP10)
MDDKSPINRYIFNNSLEKMVKQIKFDVKVGDKIYSKKYSPEEIESKGLNIYLDVEVFSQL